MNRLSVTLELPESVYERLVRVAQDRNLPVENLLNDTLTLLFGDDAESGLTLERLEVLSDAQLWAIVYRPVAWPVDARLSELNARGQEGDLTAGEQAEVKQLIAVWDRFVLFRSQALLLLQQRGHDIESRLKLGA